MASFTDRLALLITADVAGAERGIRSLGSTAERELGKASTAGEKFSATALKVGAASVGLGVVVGKGLLVAAHAANEADLAQAKMNNTLANSPQLAGVSAKSFTDLATKVQSYSVLTDEAVLSSEALLGQFGLSEKQIHDLTPLVVDLSRKMGIDLDAAARAVGKAVDGNTGTLQRYGVLIKANADGTVGYANVVDALRGKVGGFAAAEGRTFEGQLARTKNQAGELGEALGHGVIDSLDKLLGPVNSTVHAMRQIDASTDGAVGRIATFGSAAAIGIGGLALLAGAVTRVRTALDVATASEGRFGAASATLGRAGLVGVGIVAVGEALDFVSKKVDQLEHGSTSVPKITSSLLDFGNTGKAGGELAKQFGNDLGGIADKLKDIHDASAFSFLGPFEAEHVAVRDAKKDIDALDKGLAGLVTSGHADVAAKILERLGQAGVPVEKLKGHLNDYHNALDAATVSQKLNLESLVDEANAEQKAAQETKEHTKALEDQFSAEQKLPAAQRSLDDAFKAVGDTLDAQDTSLQNVADAHDRVNDAVAKANEAQQKYNEVLADTDAVTKELEHDQDALNKAVDAHNTALTDQRKAQDAVNVLLLKGAGSDSLKLQEARDALAAANDNVTSTTHDQADAAETLAKAQAGDTQHAHDLAAAKKDLDSANKDVAKSNRDLAKAEDEAGRAADAAKRKQGELQQKIDDVGAAAAAQADVIAQAAGRGKASLVESADAQIIALVQLQAQYPQLATAIQASIDLIVSNLLKLGVGLVPSGPPPLQEGTPHAKGLPTYQRGGVVGGPRGKPQFAIVHGGETVVPEDVTPAAIAPTGTDGASVNIVQNIYGVESHAALREAERRLLIAIPRHR